MTLHLHHPIRVSSVKSSLTQLFAESKSSTDPSCQLAAELWIERFLNHLNEQLQSCRSSIKPTEPLLWQILIDELSQALSGAVAIGTPRKLDENAISDQFEIRYVARSEASPALCLAEVSISQASCAIELGNTLTLAEIDRLKQLEYQSAWELSDLNDTIGWLIAVPLIAFPIEESFLRLRAQLVNRAIAQTLRSVRQARNTARLLEERQQLQAQNQELRQTSQLKSEFLANTSHEIRTPLCSILGFTHLLREQSYNPSNPRHQEYLRIILSSGQHLLALINDILDLSKIEANQLTLQPDTIEVCEVCKLALKLVQEKANDKGLPLKLAIAPDVSTLIADPLRLKQMLFNLLSNALKFTTRGSVGLQVNVIDQFVHFTVWDTGTGISEEQQNQLFRPYGQLANAKHGEGTGLGLALTQKLAELHGGWIQVKSVIDQGSRFTIALPLQSELPTPIADAPTLDEPATLQNRIADRPNRILLVEDNAHNARLVIAYLCKLGYEVTWKKDSIEMWRSLNQAIPALILMDINLPGIDGLTLTQELRSQKRYESIPIIVQTAKAMKGDREKCLEAGATDYVSKPIDLVQLAQTVAKYSQKR